MHRPWLDVYHLKASQRTYQLAAAADTGKAIASSSNAAGGKETKLKISAINIQWLMCMESWCFGLDTECDGKQQSIIGYCRSLWLSGSHTASQWKTTNSQPTDPSAVLNCLEVHVNLDCNLKWVVSRGSVNDNLLFCSAQQKNCFCHCPLVTSVYSPFSTRYPNVSIATSKTKKESSKVMSCLLFPANYLSSLC